MRSASNFLQRVVQIISNIVFFSGVIVMAIMALHITADVVARYVFKIALPGTIAFVQNYYMIAVTFLPLVIAEKERQHIEVEVVAERFSPPLQALLRLLAWIIASIVFLTLGWVSSSYAWEAYQTGTFIIEQNSRIETWMSYFMLPVGFLSSALISVSRVLIAGLGLFTGDAVNAVDVASRYFDNAQVQEMRDV